jgi:adenylate cyclase
VTAVLANRKFLIAFLDFSRFDVQCQRVSDLEIATTLNEHYQRVTPAVEGAGGRVIKFIGDATLVVFPEAGVDAGVRMILDLIASEDRLMAEKGWECRLTAKAHFGEVVAGDVGPVDHERFDIFGRAVNATARLKGSGPITLSDDAFRLLPPDLQNLIRPTEN